MNVADNAEVVGVRFVRRKCVGIAELGIDVEPQQERHLGVWRSFPDDDPISYNDRRLASGDELMEMAACTELLAEAVAAGGAGTISGRAVLSPDLILCTDWCRVSAARRQKS